MTECSYLRLYSTWLTNVTGYIKVEEVCGKLQDAKAYCHKGFCFLIFSWGRWTDILAHSRFKRPMEEKDVENVAKAIVSV